MMKINNSGFKILMLVMLLSMVFGLAGCTATEKNPSAVNSEEESSNVDEIKDDPAPSDTKLTREIRRDSSEVNHKYLETFFNIKLEEKVTAEQFVKALVIITGDEELKATKPNEELNFQNAISYAVKAAGFEELALIYEPEKAKEILAEYGITQSEEENANYLACATIIGILSSENVEKVNNSEVVDRDMAATLLVEATAYTGNGRNFIAYSDDADIYSELQHKWNSFVLFEDEKLIEIGVKAVSEQITTGYNLYHKNNNANFIPELSLRYSHSTIRHAQQLIGLLQSEDIVVKVQLEPKVSTYTYMPEWGPAPDATPQYEVRQMTEDLQLVFATEFDLVLEFETPEEKLAFDGLVNTYAKKNTGEEEKALLFGSWWQPLYVSSVEMGEGYKQIYDNVIIVGDYSIHPFSMEAETKDKLEALDSTIKVEQVKIWVDDAFYRYLLGEAE